MGISNKQIMEPAVALFVNNVVNRENFENLYRLFFNLGSHGFEPGQVARCPTQPAVAVIVNTQFQNKAGD